MAAINGINEVAHPLLIFVPIILMLASGYTIGRIASLIRKVNSIMFRDFIYGNIAICFLFIAGFIFFGVLSYEAKAFFMFFTYALIALSVLGAYFLLKSIATKSKNKLSMFNRAHIPILFAIPLFLVVLGYISIIIYYHPIFTEYDSLYLYLPISKSILLGNGLNHDFYTGSDIAIRVPPLGPALNAWIMDSFGYSSMRLFPLYFILMGSLMTYLLARNITKDSFLGLIAAIVFLILPVTLVVSSRFSLQQDLIFIFFLTASFYFLSELVKATKLAKTHLLMLIVSLSLMVLSREIGLILSIAIFFVVPAIKFTKGNPVLKGIFTVLSLIPLYTLTAYDLSVAGATYTIILRLLTLLIANIVIFVITLYIRDQESPKKLLPNLKYLLPLAIPAVFIIGNIVMFNGPYPSVILSEEYSQSLAVFRDIFELQDDRNLGLTDAISNLPRIDILFISLGLGSIFIFFKLWGFVRIIKNLRSDPQYAISLILIAFLLIVWSYALDSNYERAEVRHLIYFAPLLSVIVVVGMSGKEWYHRFYYYGVVVFSTFYFLSYNIEAINYNGHFGGFWIDPNKDPIITPFDLLIGTVLIVPLVLLELRNRRAIEQIKTHVFNTRYLIPAFAGLIVIEIFVFYSSNIILAPIETMDQITYPGWESYVMEVSTYLNSAEDGNVLSLRAPAISFFTNRTNFDLYSPQTFVAVSELLSSHDQVALKEKLHDMNIRYVVMPNERSILHNRVQNLDRIHNITQILESDGSFEKINLHDFNIYKVSSSNQMNLVDPTYRWIEVNDADVHNRFGSLIVYVKTNNTSQLFNRASLQTEIDLIERPLLLSLRYSSQSYSGNATFALEIRDTNNTVLWTSPLHNTLGVPKNESFILPNNVVGVPVEFRIYITTDQPGEHKITFEKLIVTYT